MVDPEFFEIRYSINPFMQDKTGELKKIDKVQARRQWDSLVEVYLRLGFEIEILKGKPNLPDMVFAANQSFPFWSLSQNRAEVVLARMASPYRTAEVSYFAQWYEKKGYVIHEIENKGLTFEGNGDVVTQFNRPIVWAANGPRTSDGVAECLAKITDYSVVSLALREPNFYHLDTCFSVLNDSTVALYPQAFDKKDLEKIRAGFEQVIEIGLGECRDFFSGNCHSPDGKNVISQKGTKRFKSEVEKRGFTVIELDTSEFIKAGGSVFCLKMMVF